MNIVINHNVFRTSFPVKGRTFQNLKLLNRKEVNVTDQFDCSASSSSEERDENAEVDVTALRYGIY